MQKLEPGTSLQVGSHSVEILQYLAEGGFAHIYTVKCSPAEDEHDTAVLKRVIVKSKVDLNLLRKEVDTMQRLATSKYVVRYYDSNAQKLEDGTYEVLVLMEYCPNKSLLDYMNLHLKTKLTIDQITKIMYQISSALYSMHYLNLIHRDLKIENVLIDSDENFKLADFGSTTGHIAPPKSQEEFQYIANDIIHNTTPQYRAPEMIDLYRNIPIDNKSDIWALGVFLYKLMYYTTPFETQGDLAILHGYFKFPETPKYPSKLKNLVIIMLQVNPNLRPNIYQVLHEICKLIKKPFNAEDFYALGPYDFDAYAKFQQQLQFQQQEQQVQIQQQYIQQQYLEQQRKQAEIEKQKSASDIVEETLTVEETHNSLMQQPHELTRSSNPSVGDLSELERELENDEDDVNSVVDDDDNDDDDLGENPELNNVEERFPDLEALDEKILAQKYPEIDSSFSPKLDGGSASSPSSKVETMALSQGSTSRTPSTHSKSNLAQEDFATNELSQTHFQAVQSTEDTKTDGAAPSLGLKLAHTEAWTLPSDSEQTKNIEIDGVFHKSEPNSPANVIKRESRPVQLSEKSSFDKLFEFEASNQGDGNVSVSDRQSVSLSQSQLKQSRNPFPTAHENTSKNPFPSSRSTLDVKVNNTIKPQRSGGNPWAQFTSQAPTQQQPQQQKVSYTPMATSNSFTYGAIKTQPPLQALPKYVTPQTSNINLSSIKTGSLPKDNAKSFGSPLIKITPSNTDNKLVDIDGVPAHSRPKLDLKLLDYEVSDEKSMVDSTTTKTKAVVDSDTDSDGGLKVEEIQIPKNRSKQPSSSTSRKSAEISRLSLELEEMDLNDSTAIVDDKLEELQDLVDGDARHSRRSMSLRRPSSMKPRSRSNRRSEESNVSTSNKRKSFLGF